MIKIFKSLLVLSFLTSTAAAQQLADSLLPEALITAYGVQKPERNVPAAVSTLQPQDFERFGEATPVLAFQQLPGVRLEERAPGSYRVSIRGSSLRSPYGVRNVKVYWNNIPVTEANGSTPLNMLDVNLYRQVEVIRGPAASYYGAGTGGVINIGSLPTTNTGGGRPMLELGLGSFSYRRASVGYQKADSVTKLHVGVTHLKTKGYRQHNNLERQNAFWSSSFKVSDKREFQASLLLARIKYQIPGGLTQEQYDQDPRQARPGNPFIRGSVEQNASINQHYGLLGVGQHYQFTDKLENSSWFFGHGSFLNHPFLTDYERNQSTGFGSRSIWNYALEFDDVTLDLQFGSEVKIDFEVARSYGNIGGKADTLRFEDELTSRAGLYFLQADVEVLRRLSLTAGFSYNDFSYKIERLVDADPANAPNYALRKKFVPVLAPRIAMAYQLLEGLQLYGQVSKGFSPPSLEEIRTSEGSLNAGLEAEEGTNYEVGLKGNSAARTLQWSATAYYFSLQQTITSYTEGNSVVRYKNAGSARQIGLETALELRLLRNQNWLLNTSFSAALQDYEFIDYINKDEDFSGNAIPGVAPITTSLTFDALYRGKLGLYLTHSYTDEIALNDANTFYGDDFNLVQARLEYRPGWWQEVYLRLFVSGQNLLNEKYSLGNDLNAFGNRFYQPAATRSFFAGFVVEL